MSLITDTFALSCQQAASNPLFSIHATVENGAMKYYLVNANDTTKPVKVDITEAVSIIPPTTRKCIEACTITPLTILSNQDFKRLLDRLTLRDKVII